MSKKLVVVESPAKARTIKRFLGNDYEIVASMGHIRDLPENTLGIDVGSGFTPAYVETRKDVVVKLKQAAKNATDIYLAPDPDREGEAIAWHLKEVLNSSGGQKQFHRVAFHEITKSAVANAFKTPGDINLNLVDAQQARRILDRIVGYQVSPLLWSKVKKGLSAGRVQSVALRVVCEREREIQAFVPQEYWVFTAEFEHLKTPAPENRFAAKLAKIDGKKAEIPNAEEAEKLYSILQSSPGFKVSSVEVKPQQRSAPPPFITSSMQQSAGNALGMTAGATMRVAQQLYEGIDIGAGGPTGLITYMRTDSVAVAPEAQRDCRSFIESEYGSDFVPAKQRNFKVSANAQAAHEAIRPTDVTLTPEKASKFLDSGQLRLYTLVWKRFVASQMAPARLEKTTVEVQNTAGERTCTFQATAVVTKFKGFMILSGTKKEDEENKNAEILGRIAQEDECSPAEIAKEQKFTEPPPRYTEASLIRELEANGIGRPSTYATIVMTIQSRGYCQREKGKLVPTEIGFSVNDYLVKTLPVLFEIGFTAEMEKQLDAIEEGRQNWQKMLADFYANFTDWLNSAKFAGAPRSEQAEGLIAKLDTVQTWEKPVKFGRRTYNDKKFFESIKEQFAKDAAITEKQWTALLNMAVKYRDQIPGFDAFIVEFSCEKEVADLEKAAKIRSAEAEQRQANLNSDEFIKLKEAFDLFENIEWEPPVKRRGRTYDDAAFFKSLKQQLESGRKFSDKQLNAFKQLAARYVDKVSDKEKLNSLLELDKIHSANAEGNKEVEQLLAELANVKNWDDPVSKGKRTFDDKSFFESLQKQYTEKKSLSSRQIYALKKMVAKYAKK